MHSLHPPWSSLGVPEVPTGAAGLVFLPLQSLNGYKVSVPCGKDCTFKVVLVPCAHMGTSSHQYPPKSPSFVLTLLTSNTEKHQLAGVSCALISAPGTLRRGQNLLLCLSLPCMPITSSGLGRHASFFYLRSASLVLLPHDY